MDEQSGIDVYRRGFTSVRSGRRWTYAKRQLKARNWGALKNHFGPWYMAEWSYPPNDPAFRHAGRCGTGWTRKGARKSLGLLIVEANLTDRERGL